ncbi:MAG: hypothetical protein HYS24_12045 [Ignavibacteriales bacterium]|nr:hypothetical protein [Ignavibacteriales bacterium]
MGGKAILLVVISFSLMFAIVNFNSQNTTTRAVENLSEYYSKTNLQNIATSGANMAANIIFKDPTWTGNFNHLPFQGGYLDINVTKFAVDKIRISSKGYLTGIYNGEIGEDTSLVKLILEPSSFSKFGYYSNKWPAGGYLVTGDTIDGPFHTQGQLLTLGSPVFMGKTTTKDGITSIGNSYGFGAADPKFLGGYESPVDVPFTLNTTKIKDAGNYDGKIFQDAGGNALDVKLVFTDDGSATGKVQYSTRKTGTSTWSTAVTAKLDTLAPNGVIWNTKGNLYVSGTVNGKYTVGTGKSGSNYGYVYLEDDIVYRKSPLISDPAHPGYTISNPACQDMLGIVAEKQVVVKDNSANRNNINIHASLFNFDGGITVEGITSSSPNMGTMKILGGLIENEAQTTGYTNGAGYHQVIKFDKRFETTTPPYFPATETYEIVSWFE